MNNIFVKPKSGPRVQVGYIEDSTLRLIDRDNYHKASKSIGLDKEILFDLDLKYEFISVKFYNKNYITTRSFFADWSVEHNLLNFRDMRFLPLSDFGLAKALRYERDISDKALATRDIHEILAEDNPRVLEKWLIAVEKEEAQKKRRVRL